MEKHPDISQLKKYLDGLCSQEEARRIEEWLELDSEHSRILLALSSNKNNITAYDKKDIKSKLFQRIRKEQETPAEQIQPAKKNKPITYWLRIAAVFLIFALTLSLIYTNSPFTRTAFLTEAISPSQTVTLVILPDGTQVQLNANSILRYPSSFSEKERTVYLEGQAFLKVTKDGNRPFKVITDRITTTVLGTEFNVNYLPEIEKVEVALAEGKVSVSHKNWMGFIDSEVTLQPDQWISYSPGDTEIEVQHGIENKILWRDGTLHFDGMPLAEVAEVLQDWYGIEVRVQDSEAKHCKVAGSFKGEDLENILSSLQFVTGIDFEIDKGEVKLWGGSCE